MLTPNQVCQVCGNPFYARPGYILKGWGKYCSLACRGKAFSKSGSAYTPKEIARNTVTRVCVVCGKDFEVYPSDAARRKAIYCSYTCKGKAMQILPFKERRVRVAKPQPPTRPKPTKVLKHCQICKAVIQGGGKKYCSIVCRSKGWSGEGNPLYKPKVKRVCEICEAGFEVVPAVVSYGQGRFCSRRCWAMWKGKQEGYSRGRGGKRPDLNNQYFRSTWEANYARYLNWLIKIGEILEWAYEPDTFEFTTIKRGHRFYTPDFRVINLDHSREYHEIKGWMDKASQTKLSRMAKFYPEIKVVVIDSDAYRALARDVKRLVPNWETIK